MEGIRRDRPEGSVEQVGIHSFISVVARIWRTRRNRRAASDLIGSTLCRRIGISSSISLQLQPPSEIWLIKQGQRLLAACTMEVFSKSKNMSEGKFTQPPDEGPKPDPPKRKPLLKPKLPPSFDCEAFTNDVELPPFLQATQTQQPATSPGRSPSVKFDLPKQKAPRKRRRRATLYDAVAGMNSWIAC